MLALAVTAQPKFTLNGFIRDSLSGESLTGANLSLGNDARGATSNSYGFYSLTLVQKTWYITASYVGYAPKTIAVALDSSFTYNFDLVPANYASTNVVVTGRRRDDNVKQAQMGRIDLSMERIKQIPALLGEVDPLKALQFLPGVRNAGEGNAGIYVRGGGPDQNLIMLDDAVVYNSGHLFGFFSVFNGDAIKNVSLIKGGMPSQYGGRLSSVVDVTMKDGNNQTLQTEGGIGLLASRFSVQGPVQKGKSSFLVAGRRTYIDALASPFLRKGNLAGSGYYFYDLNTKMNFQLGPKDRLYLSGYFGRDVFDFKNKERAFNTSIPWGNTTATVRWNHVFNRRLFSNTTLVYNDYKFKFDASQYDFRFILSSGIRDLNAKVDFDYFLSPEHKIKYGAQYTFHTFLPNQLSGNQGSTSFEPRNTGKKYAREYAFYVQDDWEVNERLKVNAGLRFSGFTQVGRHTRYINDALGNPMDSVVYGRGQTVKDYNGLEPRLTIRYSLTDAASIKGAVTRNLQYIHLATNSGTTLPTDLWVPSTYRTQPQLGWQYAVGYFQNFSNNTWETSVELYYKTMSNQIEYREGYTPSLSDPEEDFVYGKGWSYGAEFFINKTRGRLTGWIGYTLSWTWRQFDELNFGNKFPTKYDRRHDLSIVAAYDLSAKWKLGGDFVFGTGNATTYPERFYVINGVLTQEFSKINAYRLPSYHRLDLSATYTPKPKSTKRFKTSWVFGIYNTYSRLNPYFIYFDQEGDPLAGTQKITALKVSLFPILPSATWNFKF
ncbi:MAG: TonB-dependent receptor [Bacteroidetes bacterium]|nr:MAG: TonB-dependent receptor [Bacteroidota bacterium]